MARVNVADFVSPGDDNAGQEPDNGPTGEANKADNPADSAGASRQGSRRPVSRSLSKAAAAAHKQTSPKFAQLRGEQQIELDVLARELQAARTTKRERITANTLIRVAIDGLLSRRDVLVGDTEEELLASYLDYIKRLENQGSESSEPRES